MPNHASLASLFGDIADAIRGKTGGSAQIVADDFPTAIAAISAGARVGAKSATRTNGNSISFSNLSGRPQAFYFYLAESTSTSGVITDVLCDGTNIAGHYTAASSSGKVTFNDSGYSFSYSNGTLTVTAQVYAALASGKTYYLIYAY